MNFAVGTSRSEQAGRELKLYFSTVEASQIHMTLI